MDVTKDRFAVEVLKIIQDIAESHFVAIDLEFSGVAGRTQRVTGKPTLQELYEETKVAAEKYQVLQVGLTVVKEDTDKGRYVFHPYNFNINPLPSLAERTFRRDWTMSSGAVSFLMRNKFDFGQTLMQGIPYLSRDEAKQVRSKLLGEDTIKNADMELKSEDDALIKHIRLSMRDWMQQPMSTRESYLNIPSEDRGKGVPGTLNKYQIRLSHQVVQNEFPAMKTASMHHFVQVTDPSHPETIAQMALQARDVDREVSRATGFRWLLEALVGGDITQIPDSYLLAARPRGTTLKEGTSALTTLVSDLDLKLRQRRRVLVGHNCFTDLVYLLRFFDGHLPDHVHDFQDRVHELFPAVIDTKKLASFGNGRWRDTSLEYVDEEMQFEEHPVIIIPPEFDRYNNNDMQHEAGYDSLLTARIAVRLSAKLDREGLYLEEATKAERPVSDHFGEPLGYVTADQFADGSGFSNAGAQELEEKDDTGIVPQSVVKRSLDPEDQETTLLSSMLFTSAVATKLLKEDTAKKAPTTTPDVIVVKEKKSKSISWSEPAEVEKVRSTFANSTIYDVLDGTSDKEEVDDTGYEADSDLVSYSETELPIGEEAAIQETHESIETMVKNGQLMPRWNKGVFWTEFGNKLQVNSCKEETCEF